MYRQTPITEVSDIQSALEEEKTFCDPCQQNDNKTMSAKSYCAICDSKFCASCLQVGVSLLIVF